MWLRSFVYLLFGISLSLIVISCKKSDSTEGQAAGETANFKLSDHRGKSHELYSYADKKAVVIVVHGNDCPIVQQNVRTIHSLRDKFQSREVAFLMLNANPQDNREKIAKEAAAYDVEIPILLDKTQEVAKAFGFTRTAEVAVLDPQGWKKVYHGAIDDRLGYGAYKLKAKNNYLNDALEQFLAGQPVKPVDYKALGCAITFLKKPPTK